MATYYLILVLAWLSLLLLTVVSSQESCVNRSVYYVSSKTGTDTEDCLRPGQRDHPCGSLTYLTDSIHQCATMEILDNITLDNTVVVLNSSWDNIAIEGSSSTSRVTIFCESDSGIVVQDTNNIAVYNLIFNNCSFNSSSYYSGSHESLGPTVILFHNTAAITISHCSFINHRGSAMMLLDIYDTTIIEKSVFQGSVSLLDQDEFRSGGIVVRSSQVEHNTSLYIDSCYFSSSINEASVWNLSPCSPNATLGYGGAIDFIIDHMEDNITSKFIISNCSFYSNMAAYGGAVSVRLRGNFRDITVAIISSNFSKNTACLRGGALYFANEQPTNEITQIIPIQVNESRFFNNTAKVGGAATAEVLCKDCSGLHIEYTTCEWKYNNADDFGNALYLAGAVAYFAGLTKFELNGENTVAGLGTILASNSLVILSKASSEITSNMGTAMVLVNTSQAHINGNVSFNSNVGVLGGALLIEDRSHVIFSASSIIVFHRNIAWVLGGAIFSRVSGTFCGILIKEDAKVRFEHNQANKINQSVAIKNGVECLSTALVLRNYSYIPEAYTQILIDNGEITLKPTSLEVMLGQTFYLKPYQISLQNVGYLRLWTEKDGYSFDVVLRGPSTLGFDDYNSNIEFFIQGRNITKSTNYYIRFFYENSQYYHMGQTNVSVLVVPCRIGYRYDPEKQICICSSKSDKVKCSDSGLDLCVQRHYWYSDEFDTAFPCPVQNCWYMYGRCPSKSAYCAISTDYCSITDSDDLCWKGRSGLLCSACAANHSFTYSAFECVPSTTCSSRSTGLLMLALLTYWMLAVLGILVVLSLDLSVGSGIMHGIVYFFSISMIYTKRSSLFNDLWIRIVLYVDMAITWLDPELIGYFIQLCFAKSWDNPLPHYLFRFATPLFIILVIVAIVFISRYIKLPKRFSFAENSPIHAICMLILLSYTSVACTSFKLLIPLPVNHTWRVQIAPEIYFFSKEHIPYALIAIFLEIFVSLPICILFLFANPILRYVNLVKFRLKPIVDEFQACYRPGCYWFAGFYFLARLVIFFISEISLDTPQSNVVMTTVNVLIVIIHTSFQPYKKKWLNILDTILLMDIVFLSMLKPESIEDYGKINQVFHDKIIPISLVIIPTVMLFGMISFILFKKFKHILRRRTKLFSIKLPRSATSSRASIITTDDERRNHSGSGRSLTRVDSYVALREPLLDDSYNEDDNQGTTPYRSEARRVHRTYGTEPYRMSKYTTGSFRLPATD